MGQRIGDYALLGDCQGAALVDRAGSVNWWCAPRFDSRSVFARLLDPDGGHWSIRPEEPFETRREYLPDTMAVATTFHTTGGAVRLTDVLGMAPGARAHRIGMESPHTLVRLVEGLSGRVAVELDYRPRLEYGLTTPELVQDGTTTWTVGGPDTLELVGDRPVRTRADGSAGGRFVLDAGRSVGFVLTHREGPAHRSGSVRSAGSAGRLSPQQAVADTVAGWRSWSELHRRYQGAYRPQVHRSALVLQALTYQPTAAMVAAATTSLPEVVGGSSNWDYRFSWLRDASLALRALWVGACPDEAGRYFEWMASAGVGSDTDTGYPQIMFGVGGERDLTEHELDHLAGYQHSRPVRIGNDAWTQKQLDVLGEVLEAAWILRDRVEFTEFTAGFLRALADRAATSWTEPDAGIWEGREGQRHYLISKVMCWVALDRAIELADRLRAGQRVRSWIRARQQVRAAILAEGWNERVGAYTGAIGSDRLDAGVLLMPLVGFLPAADPRMRRTIATVERELGDDGLVRRWTGASDEGAFVICSYWLADCLARAGDLDRATEVFDRVSSHANDVGLLSEQVATGTGELLSNFPQSFSHVGLINAAWSIDQHQQGQ